MKSKLWLALFFIPSLLMPAYGPAEKIAPRQNHQGHVLQREDKGEDRDFKGLTVESIRKEGKMIQPVPGSIRISPERQQLIGVKLGTVEIRPIRKVIRTNGRVDFDERRLVTVTPKIGGWIEELYVDFTGAFVRKGDPLLTIYSPELVSTQEEYLVALRARKDLIKSPFPEVVSSGNSLAESTRRRLKFWDISDDQIKALEDSGQPKKTMTLYCPYQGFVLEKMVFKGMNVSPGMVLYKLGDLSVVWIYADIYEYELPFIRLGQSASLKLDYRPGAVFTGKATYIYPSLDPKTRTAKVRFEFPNPDGALKPEMFAEVEIGIDLGRRLVLPEGAIIDTGSRRIAIIRKGSGFFEPREVKTGIRGEDYYEVLSGLKPGEQVVTSANFLIDAESKLKEAIGAMTGMEHGIHGK
ncbi:MAG: efflux RND transporter periplasmic adaptor subunit [Pseudomonadota bacterium]